MPNRRAIRDYLMISLGTALISAAVYFFMIPANLCPGSAAALAMLIGNVIPLPVSLITLILNVSLLVLGYAAEDCEPHPEMHPSRKPLEETVFYGSFENLPVSEKEQAQH